jgi:hypothetical protein
MANWTFLLDNNVVEEPIGWDAIEFTAKRMDSDGIDQPFSTEVSFYGFGAKYIKNIYDQHFINEPIAIEIISDDYVNGNPYIFSGFINLAVYQETNSCDSDSFQVSVGIIDDLFREKFKARQDIDIDLLKTSDLDGGAIDPLTFKTIRLHKQDLFLEGYAKSYSLRSYDPAFNEDVVVPIYWSQNDFKEQYGTALNTNLTFIQPSTRGQSPFFKNNGGTTRTLKATGSFDLTVSKLLTANFIDVQVYFVAFNGNVPQLPALYILDTTQNNQTVNYQITFTDVSLVIPAGFTVNLFVYASYAGNPYRTRVEINNVQFKLEELSASQFASTTQCLTIEQWLKRTIYVLTGFPNKLLSDTFSESAQGCYWNNALTNGVYLREINSQTDNNNSQLLTSWKKIFTELDKIFCLGWAFEWDGYEWKIRVESKEYFYKDNIVAEFNDVDKIVQSAKTDALRNKFYIGYDDKWKNIQIGGALSVCTYRTYFVKNKAMTDNSSAEIDLRTSIIGEGIAIEFYRRMSDITVGAATSDRPNDYDIFIIWLNPKPLVIPAVENSEFALPEETGQVTLAIGTASFPAGRAGTTTGIITNRHNIIHTPARIAYRWWKVLGMHTHGLTNKKLEFQVGEYQTDFTSVVDIYSYATLNCAPFKLDPAVGTMPIKEDSDIDPEKLLNGNYLFRPIQITFTYPQSLCEFLYLSEQTPYGKIKVQNGSLVTLGYIVDLQNKPEDLSGGTTSFTLLAVNIGQTELGPYDESWNNAYL